MYIHIQWIYKQNVLTHTVDLHTECTYIQSVLVLTHAVDLQIQWTSTHGSLTHTLNLNIQCIGLCTCIICVYRPTVDLHIHVHWIYRCSGLTHINWTYDAIDYINSQPNSPKWSN